MSNKLPIIVAQYTLKGHARRTEHWALAVLTDVQKSSARVYEVLGNTDSFTFSAKYVDDVGKSKRYCNPIYIKISRTRSGAVMQPKPVASLDKCRAQQKKGDQ